jgi:hypothetical protein
MKYSLPVADQNSLDGINRPNVVPFASLGLWRSLVMTAVVALHDPALHEDLTAKCEADRIGFAVHRFCQ